MPRFQSSIVIPVFNKWDLTRICLKSLAATTDREKVEVIVVDNASSDVTPQACHALGQKLFGDSFRYVRNEQNRNFAGASNQGARAANGEYLVFLNNDTEALPGWHEPLIDDFSRFANIAATGPVLLYPRDEIFGHTVQHLGVSFNPMYRVGHLYSGISAQSPLAKKRRFFQVITAACMMIPRSLFMEAGMFDEYYINGFEDIGLCAKLSAKGWRMTINSESHLIHYESQSEGRHANDDRNARHAFEHALPLLKPDRHTHLENDGLKLVVNEWLGYSPLLPDAATNELDQRVEDSGFNEIRDLLIEHPFWENGWKLLIKKCPNQALAMDLREKAFLMLNKPQFLIAGLRAAIDSSDRLRAKKLLATLDGFNISKQAARNDAQYKRDWCAKFGLGEFVDQYESWLKNLAIYDTKYLAPIRKQYQEFEKELARPKTGKNISGK